MIPGFNCFYLRVSPSKPLILSFKPKCWTCSNKLDVRKWSLVGTTVTRVSVVGCPASTSTHSRALSLCQIVQLRSSLIRFSQSKEKYVFCCIIRFIYLKFRLSLMLFEQSIRRQLLWIKSRDKQLPILVICKSRQFKLWSMVSTATITRFRLLTAHTTYVVRSFLSFRLLFLVGTEDAAQFEQAELERLVGTWRFPAPLLQERKDRWGNVEVG